MSARDFDPLHAFDHAERFRRSVGCLDDYRSGNTLTSPVLNVTPSAPYPELVLAFTAAEIYLKSVLRLIGVKPGDKHDLWQLFSALRPADHKSAIREYYDDVVAKDSRLEKLSSEDIPTDFDGVLKQAGQLYHSLRYIYEEDRDLPKGRVLNVGHAMEAIRCYALELLIRDERLFFLRAEAEIVDGEPQAVEGGKRTPINKDTPNLRSELRDFFRLKLSGDPFSVDELDLAIQESLDKGKA